MVIKTVKRLPAQVGCVSLVGINTDKYPVGYGNYFSLNQMYGPYIVNMWAENFEEIVRRNRMADIEVTVFAREADPRQCIGVVTDERIPAEWLNKKFCITGHGWPSVAICKAVHEFMGVEDDGSWYCGCEGEDGYPSIGGRYTYDEGRLLTKTNYCGKCKREWQTKK